jgi:hypothetical protein
VEFLSACVCAVVFQALGAVAADSGEAFESAARDHSAPRTATVLTSPTEAAAPWMHPSMPALVRDKLETAFEIAIARVTAIPECADLFSQLGADATETLKAGLYFPASPARETSVCRRSMAQTYVGGAPTWICRCVTSYSDEHVALVVIHEALHHAGLTEKPHDRKAMSSGAINKMVGTKCRF